MTEIWQRRRAKRGASPSDTSVTSTPTTLLTVPVPEARAVPVFPTTDDTTGSTTKVYEIPLPEEQDSSNLEEEITTLDRSRWKNPPIRMAGAVLVLVGASIMIATGVIFSRAGDKPTVSPFDANTTRTWVPTPPTAAVNPIDADTARTWVPANPNQLSSEPSEGLPTQEQSFPTQAPTPNLKSFESRKELRRAITEYIQGGGLSNLSVSLEYGQPIGRWDVSRVTDMSGLFADC